MAGARRKTADTATTTSPEKAREGADAPPTRQAKAGHQQKRPRPSQKGCRKRARVSEGVYKDRYGLAATVKVNGIQRECRFPRGTPIRTIQAWRDEMRGNLRTLPKGAKNTLAHDGRRYLDQVEGQLTSIKDRRRNLGMWTEKFGHIRTLALEQHVSELNGQLHQWRKERSGATCNHRRDALMNLVRVLYGRRAASGLSDLVTFPKPPPKPRWVDRAVIAKVLTQLEPGSKLRIRLELLHWTGMRPSQMGRLTPESFLLDAEIPNVIVGQGKGGKAAAVPLLKDGITAARDYIAADAFGKWSTTSANKALASAADAAGQKAFTTYQIRHSFAMGLRQSGADIADIQDLYGHTNPQTTQIYAQKDLKKHQRTIRQLHAADGRAAVKLASKERKTERATKPGATSPNDGRDEI